MSDWEIDELLELVEQAEEVAMVELEVIGREIAEEMEVSHVEA